jgi:predicted amidophosphoribosyltransferase
VEQKDSLRRGLLRRVVGENIKQIQNYIRRHTTERSIMEQDSEKSIRCQIRDEELDEFFEEHGSEDSKRPWDTEEWEEKRQEVVGDECEWCGSEEELVIHHQKHQGVEWWEVWDEIRDYAFEQSQAYEGLDKATLECCPDCRGRSFYSRETKEPEYRCQNCSTEFDEPAEKDGSIRRTDRYWDAMNSYVERDDVREWITERFGEYYEDYWDSYFDMEHTATICKSCHFAYHENGQKICSECEDEYAEYRQDMGDYVCWDCVVEVKGLEKCPECEDNWHNPEHNDRCKSCRSRLSSDFEFTTVDRVCTNCGEVWEDHPVHEGVDSGHFRDSDCETSDVKDKGHPYTVCTDCGDEWKRKGEALQHLYHNDCNQESLKQKTYN